MDVFPAHAGMDRNMATAESASCRFPRARGDGPKGRIRVVVFQDVFPAHAGMDRRCAAASWPCCRFPRARGDGPTAGQVTFEANTFSPRTRGWTEFRDRHHAPPLRFPRARGDGPLDMERYKKASAVFPAHAGMDRGGAAAPGGFDEFSPRTRGWTGLDPGLDQGQHRFPRARGDGPRCSMSERAVQGVFPAHAGMDRPCACANRPWPSFPRARGDGPLSPRRLAWYMSVFPAHAGMDRIPRSTPRATPAVFPAHAGMDRHRAAGAARQGRFPRARGDGPRR